MKKIIFVLIICLLVGCSYSQFSQVEAVREHFRGGVLICELPFNNYYIVKVNNEEIWIVAVEDNRTFKGNKPPNITFKRRVVFTTDPSIVL